MNIHTLTKKMDLLEQHPIFRVLKSIEQLHVFMEHHVFAVWDFMSLLKELQSQLAPDGSPWLPNTHAQAVRLINEIVLEEESDLAIPGSSELYASHFEIYLNSMSEVGASTSGVFKFLDLIRSDGLEVALRADFVPLPARNFMATTFETIQTGKVHEIAASFAYGRENLVPRMFLRIIGNSQLDSKQCPLFYYYLERHAHLDGEQHGPMAEKLVNSLIMGDPMKKKEVDLAAKKSIEARIQFWDQVILELPNN